MNERMRLTQRKSDGFLENNFGFTFCARRRSISSKSGLEQQAPFFGEREKEREKREKRKERREKKEEEKK
jgi:hypothetical protein